MKTTGSYVWIWLPGDSDPTLCGFLHWQGRAADFAYVKSYLANVRALSMLPDWSLGRGSDSLYPAEDDALPGFIADVAPGRWAEYVLERLNGAKANAYERLIQAMHARTGALAFGPSHRDPPADAAAHSISRPSLLRWLNWMPGVLSTRDSEQSFGTAPVWAVVGPRPRSRSTGNPGSANSAACRTGGRSRRGWKPSV